jgi:hypothetical protein
LSNLNNKTKIDGRDVSAGALLLVTGGIAAYVAVDFDNESRMFPLVVAILLAVTGAAIAIHAALKPNSAFEMVQ